jgi:hypothetical protein
MAILRPVPIRRPRPGLPVEVALLLAVVIAACGVVAGPGLFG